MKPSVAGRAARMRPISRYRRIGHLRALIKLESIDSDRRKELMVLLRDEMTGPPSNENRTL
jgi:hypothetical protein